MSWFTQYRPATLEELHLTSVRSALETLTQGETFPHALLFAGPKGTGKTSSARILAAMLNDPANSKQVEAYFFGGAQPKKPGLKAPNPAAEIVTRIRSGSSLVVHELDAASNRGIDDIRALKERLALPPQEGKVAVYILDEVHMLTNEAFNALLKVLEEPPAHVVFILATTELHKIPDTVASRCLLIPFRQATQQELVSALTPIVKAEQLKLESDQVLESIADAAAGSFRDAVKLLEQAAQAGPALSVESIEGQLHRGFLQDIPTLIQAVLDKDQQAVAQLFRSFRDQHANPEAVYLNVMEFLHQQLLLGMEIEDEAGSQSDPIAPPKVTLFLLQNLQSLDVSAGPIPLLPLEVALLDLVFRAQAKSSSSSTPGGASSAQASVPVKKKSVTAPKPAKAAAGSELPTEVPVVVSVESPMPDQVGAANQNGPTGDASQLLTNWSSFLQTVQHKNTTLLALLRSAKPITAEAETATIAVYYPFHQEQLQQPKFLSILEECAHTVTGGQVKLKFVVQSIEPPPGDSDAAPSVKVSVDDPQPDSLEELAKSALI